MLPIKTTIEDIDVLCNFLRSQIGWVALEKLKKTIDPRIADNRKLEASRRLGIVERDGANIKLTERGRTYANGDANQKAEVFGQAIRDVPLYSETLDWIYYSEKENPSKTIVGNYWFEKHNDQLEGAQGAALTDAVIFFMRVAGGAGLGTFTRGSGGRPDSYLKTNASAIEAFVKWSANREGTEEASDTEVGSDPDNDQTVVGVAPQPSGDTHVRPRLEVSTSPAVHVNVEIHIAADATAETVAEIFKNMRKYVLSDPGPDGHR